MTFEELKKEFQDQGFQIDGNSFTLHSEIKTHKLTNSRTYKLKNS